MSGSLDKQLLQPFARTGSFSYSDFILLLICVSLYTPLGSSQLFQIANIKKVQSLLAYMSANLSIWCINNIKFLRHKTQKHKTQKHETQKHETQCVSIQSVTSCCFFGFVRRIEARAKVKNSVKNYSHTLLRRSLGVIGGQRSVTIAPPFLFPQQCSPAHYSSLLP